jgi:hypothetical protein
MQALLELSARRHIDLRRGASWPTAEVVQCELQIRVQAMTALQRLIISARADGERLLHLRRTAAQRLSEALAWAARTEGAEAISAEECCIRW